MSFITMQHELHNKSSIFEFHSLAARYLEDTVKHKGFKDFFTLRYLKKLLGLDISSLTDIQFCLVWLICFYLKCPKLAVLFIKPFKVKQFKRSLTRDFELVVM